MNVQAAQVLLSTAPDMVNVIVPLMYACVIMDGLEKVAVYLTVQEILIAVQEVWLCVFSVFLKLSF